MTARDALFSAIKFNDDLLTSQEQIYLKELFKNALVGKACPSMFGFLKKRCEVKECNEQCYSCWLHREINP